MLKEKLDLRKDLQLMLFRRAWLVSKESLDEKMDSFPFYGNWKSADLGGVHIYVHDTLKIHYVETRGGVNYFSVDIVTIRSPWNTKKKNVSCVLARGSARLTSGRG